jgi:thioredoxin reductase
MASVVIVGDGPGGLSTALFLAKNGQDVIVLGQDKSSMHYAMLYNYLGIEQITGTEFQKVARRQIRNFGATIVDQQVSAVERSGEGFAVKTENGESYSSDYLVIAEGKGLVLAKSLGLPTTDRGVEVDRNFRTSINKLYFVGRGTEIPRSQAIISAGQGAVAALDILSAEKGKDFNDFDTPPKD